MGGVDALLAATHEEIEGLRQLGFNDPLAICFHAFPMNQYEVLIWPQLGSMWLDISEREYLGRRD